jgi:preprotein translocase subunit SecY
MWLGEKITDKGIGNGISLLIMVVYLLDCLYKSLLLESRTTTVVQCYWL